LPIIFSKTPAASVEKESSGNAAATPTRNPTERTQAED
jgi:hypothetical protein